MAVTTNKVSMENLVTEARVVKPKRAYTILIVVTAVACILAVVMTVLFALKQSSFQKQVTTSSTSSGPDQNWPLGQCPEIPPFLHPLPTPLPDEFRKIFDNINDYLESFVNKKNGLPAISANVFYQDAIIWTGHYGKKTLGGEKPNDDTRYRIGSITKVFPVLMLYKMYELGLISSIDDPLDKYASNFFIKNPFNKEKITLRQIASQMSGLPREAPCVTCVSNETTQEQLKVLKNRSLVIEPGTVPSYSNLGYALLGRLLTENRLITNKTFEDWVKNNLLSPLGLKNTGFHISKEVQKNMAFSYNSHGKLIPFMNIGWLGPAGQMYSTVPDMARFGMFLAGASTNQSLMRWSSLRDILAPVNIAPDGQTLWGSPWEMFFFKHFLLRTKGGGIDGYTAMTSLVPELKLGFNFIISSVIANSSGSNVANSILDRAYSQLLPALNKTLFKLNKNETFKGDATVFIGTYNCSQMDQISGLKRMFTATIKTKDIGLEYRDPDGNVLSLYFIKDESFLQGRKYGSSCLSQRLGTLYGFYFEPKGSDGRSPGFAVPNWGVTAVRIPDER